MKSIQYMLGRQPLASVVIIFLLSFVAMAFVYQLFVALVESQQLSESCAKLLTGIVMLLVLARRHSPIGVGFITQENPPGKHWRLLLFLMVLSTPLNFLLNQVNFSELVFSRSHAIDWLLRNLASGIWEESLFRGIFFTVFLKAWGTSRNNLYKAVVVQALLFGALHMINMQNSSFENVLFQIPRAMLAGIGFAGLAIYSRSIWPPVLVHAGINAAGSFDNFFAGPVYVFPQTSILFRVIELSIIVFFVALPGWWCLKQAAMSFRPAANTGN